MEYKSSNSGINPSMGDDVYLCHLCHHDIPEGALFCSKCNSYQDWRRYLSIPQLSLALIAAIISIAGIVIPEIYKIVHVPVSKAMISTPTIDGTTLRLAVLNNGDAPAVLTKVELFSDFLSAETKVRMRNDKEAIIQPGTNILVFDIIPLLNESQSYKDSISMLGHMIKQTEPPKTELLFTLVQSNGNFIVQGYQLTSRDLFGLLRANSSRCSAITVPNFENGCIGSGEAIDN